MNGLSSFEVELSVTGGPGGHPGHSESADAHPPEDEKLYGEAVGSDALYREAMGLPDDERATLAVRLLASVDEPAVDDSVESYTAWLRDIEQRLDALLSGEDPGEDWDDVHKDLVADYDVG